MSEMQKALINDSTSFEITKTNNNETLLNGSVFMPDIASPEKGKFHILHENTSYRAELIEAIVAEKKYIFKINGNTHTVVLKDSTDLLLEKMGLSSANTSKLNNLKAPMPGLIFDMKVSEGQEVKKGDVLLILVAMKMENAIKATGEGKVKIIKVAQNDTVEKGQILIEFE